MDKVRWLVHGYIVTFRQKLENIYISRVKDLLLIQVKAAFEYIVFQDSRYVFVNYKVALLGLGGPICFNIQALDLR